MSETVLGTQQTAYRLELTPGQLKITHTALRSLLDDFGRDQREIARVIREVLDKLPSDAEVQALDVSAELGRRR